MSVLESIIFSVCFTISLFTLSYILQGGKK